VSLSIGLPNHLRFGFWGLEFSEAFDTKMKFNLSNLTIIAISLLFVSGCATYHAQKVEPTEIMRAQMEIPEDQLMDVGILVFDSEDISEEEAEDEGTNNDIRQAESHFIPYHLKNTMNQSSQWGAVRVIPGETDSVDLLVKGKILESNGEYLGLQVDVTDATGENWFSKKYRAKASRGSYDDIRLGEKDAFQDLYNTIANDIAEFKQNLSADDIRKIRTTAELKYAADFAPDAFDEYLVENKKGVISINRLPADDDPMMQRLLRIREREYMYVDTLNQQYDLFYNDMWASYENWRNLNLTERQAMKEIKKRALTRQLIGALLVAGAVAAGSIESINTGALQTGMIIIGGQVIISGFNISKEAEIHEAAIQELSDSFSGEMKPIVMEFEGKQYELTGSAEDQFNQWRELLRKIYYAETGFTPEPTENDEGRMDNNE
jgi:hypothetical protein